MSLATTPLSPFLATDGYAGMVYAPTECTVAQAAKILDVPEACVYEMFDLEVFEYRREGNQFWIDRDSLLKYDAERRKGQALLAEMTRWNQEMGLYDMEPYMEPQ